MSPLWGDGLSHNYSQSHPVPSTATPDLNAHLKVLRWRKAQHKQKHQPWRVTVINECQKLVFRSITIENKLRLIKVIVTVQQMKRELLGFWQLRLTKSEDLLCSSPSQTGTLRTMDTALNTMGSCWNKHNTCSWQNWHLRIYNELLGSITLGFQSGRFHLWKTTGKYFVFFQANLQTLGSWLCQMDALLGAVNLPGLVRWSST